MHEHSRPRLFRSAACFLTCLLGGAGCDTPPEDSAATDDATQPVSAFPAGGASGVTRGIKGTLLYEKSLGNKHAVQFYEFPHGGVAVRESLPIDDKQKAFLDTAGSFDNLTTAFQRLNPGVAIPALVAAADQRFAEARRLSVGLPANAPKVGTAAAVGSRAPAVLASQSCSGDNYGDGWGGDWFTSNFCNEGNFRSCFKNSGSVVSGRFKRPWASWRQMEGDFNVAGHIEGAISDCHWWGCDPRTHMFSYPVPPRQIEIWNYGGTDDIYDVFGSSPCGHVHVAFLRN